MSEAVKITSYQNGITLRLNSEVSFEDILSELALKFTQGKNFFGKASVALSIEGREVTDVEELQIIDAIKKNSDVNIICIIGRNEETDRTFIKALQQVEKKLAGGDEGQFYKGTLKNGDVLDTENSIIIMGDVNPGCTVISAKNIIVLGGLYGEAYAGGNGQEKAYVVALEMEPERLSIGDFKYKSKEKQSKWGIRPKVQPKIAYVKNEKIVMEPLTKELLASF